MNKAQVITLLTTLIVGATSAAVSKLGINIADYTKDIEDGLLIIAAIAAWAYQHFFHNNATVVNNDTGVVKSGTADVEVK